MRFKLLPMLLLFSLENADALEFSQSEWTDPTLTGSTVWLKNAKPRAVIVKSIYFRNDGFRTGDEIALTLGREKLYYAVEEGTPGQWRWLIPKGGRAIRVRAPDSLLIHGIEYGNALKARQKRNLAEAYVLDLKLADAKGDTCVLKVSESAPNYFIDVRAVVRETRSGKPKAAGDADSESEP